MQLVRVDDATHKRLKTLSRQLEKPMGELIGEVVAVLEEQAFWRAANAAFSLADEADEAERQELEGTLLDGLENDEPYPERIA